MKSLLVKKSVQVKENLTGIALGNGFSLPKGMNRKDWAEQKLVPNLEQDEYLTIFFESLLEVEKIRDYFVTQLKKTLNPKQYGIEREWRQTQKEGLEAIICAFENWFTRPLVEIPTGTGKSMIWGAIIRAFYDTLRVFGVEDKFEITLFTSRINIADQMIGFSVVLSEDTEDEPLIYGDVKMWLPMLTDEDIRILAGRSRSPETGKNAKLTLACYQGLNAKTVDVLFSKKAGLVLLDESHRVTDRIRITLENKMHTAFFVGGSATTKGHKWNNPFIFFEAMKPEEENGEITPYKARLAYHTTILECIQRRELKQVRYINARTYIDLSSVISRDKELPAQETAKVIAKNIPIMKKILEELFLMDHPVLNVTGTKSVIDRKWLIFVDRIKIAEELTLFCNNELKQFIAEKYHNKQFVADYVSGELGIAEFNKRMDRYHNNEATIMFTSEKLGEGADVPEINGILSFRPYSVSALWKAIQEIGRGTRFIPGEDLLVVDGVFKSDRHEVGSLVSIFGVNMYLNGGLVAGYTGQREVEMKIFNLLKEGLVWKQIWNNLTEEERELAVFIRKYLDKETYGPEVINLNDDIDIKTIEFIENETVRLHELLEDKENLVEMAKDQLKQNDINDYWDLTYKIGLTKFKKLNFGIFSSAIYFCRYLGIPLIINRKKSLSSYYLTYETLDLIASKFDWLPSDEQKMNRYKEELAKHGITDYWNLVYAFPGSIQDGYKVEFGVFGKGIAFISAVLNKKVKFNLEALLQVADKLFPISEEQKIERYKKELAEHGITDYWSLISYTYEEFEQFEFGIFGKISGFLNLVVGKQVLFNGSSLDLLAKKVGFMPTEEEKIARYKEELKEHGITNYWELKFFDPKTFEEIEFKCIRKSASFIGQITGTYQRASKYVLGVVADKIFSLSEEQKIERYKEELAKHGITDYWGLVFGKNITDYLGMKFGPFGGLSSFISEVLTLKKPAFAVRSIIQVADKLFPLSEEQKIERYKEELAKHGITDYYSLIRTNRRTFELLDFGVLGRGKIFFTVITSKTWKGESSLLDIAEKVGWFLTEDDKKNVFIQELAKHGIVDYLTLMLFPSIKFKKLNFPNFGKASTFSTAILGKTIRAINHDVKTDIARQLGWKILTDQEKIKICREELLKHGIETRVQFDAVRTDNFVKLKFGKLGGAQAFIGFVLGIKLGKDKDISRALLTEAAEKLELK